MTKRIHITLLKTALAGALVASATVSTHAPAAQAAPADAAGFVLRDTAGQSLDILQGGKVVGRYMYAYDKSTPERRTDTYKPYLHVFDAAGRAPITKGPGGQFPHHRGIYIGWNKISYGGKSYDRWHMTGGEQVHQKFLAQEADAKHATLTALVHWQDEKGQPILVEERTMTFRQAPAPAYALVDFSSKITAPNGDAVLDGDPEHAGIHFRPSNEVDTKQTVYVFPQEKAQPTKDRDYAWVGESFTLGEANGAPAGRYSVVEISAPSNPTGTRWSAYRDYGRLGAFPRQELKQGEPFTFRYRFLVSQGEMPSAETIQASANEFTGQKAEVPKTTAIPVAKPAK